MGVVAVSFVVFLLGFLGVGIWSATRRQASTEDYLLAGRNVSPWMMALSAVATNNSGFMFVGLIGATWSEGVSAAWLMVGWVAGDYLMWLVGVPERLRVRTEETGAVTLPSFMGHGIKGGKWIAALGGLITLVFLGVYASAQLTAGSKALHVLFAWPYDVGAIIGAAIVLAYCFAGGIRASIWTDVAQSVVMIVAMVLIFFLGLAEIGGFEAMWAKLAAINPRLTEWAPADLRFGFTLFLIGWFFAGMGVIGQPHIMVRALTIDHPKSIAKARRIYITWYVVFAAAAVGTGLVARALLTPKTGFDPELAMPTLAAELLPGALVGLVLAGLFAATMSTADSQVLACSSALTQDLVPAWSKSYVKAKLGTVAVTAAVLAIALSGGSVFQLVVLAWSALASGLGPVIVVRAFRLPLTMGAGLATMSAGIAGVLVWRYGLAFSDGIYDVMPGMLLGFATWGAWYVVRGRSLPAG